MPLERLGRYVNLKLLEEGGMGEVYLAEHELLPGTFAVKVLSPAMQRNPEALDRFKAECVTLIQLRHPNIVVSYEPGVEDGRWYLPMEWIQGENLQAKIEKTRSIPLLEKLRWASQMLDALAAAHERGIVHRDVKPSNIMITTKGVAKLLDFGIAHEEGAGRTQFAHPATIDFQAPEQITPGGRVDARTDIFVLGIVLYALFTGRHPFKSDDDQARWRTEKAIQQDEPIPITDLDPGLPPRLWDVLARALAKSPADRFASAAEMKEALLEIQRPEESNPDEARDRFVKEQLDKADSLIEIGGREHLARARQFVQNVLALVPDSSAAARALESIQIRLEEIEQLEALLAKASDAIEHRRFGEAHSCLKLAGSLRPGNTRVRALSSRLRDLEEADPAVAAARTLRGAEDLERQGEFAAALRIIEGLLGGPVDGDARQARVRVRGAIARQARDQKILTVRRQLESGDRDGAERQLLGLLAEDPADVGVLQLLVAEGFRLPVGTSAAPLDSTGRGELGAWLDQVAREIDEIEAAGAAAIGPDILDRAARAWRRVLDQAALCGQERQREAELRARIRRLTAPLVASQADLSLLSAWDAPSVSGPLRSPADEAAS